MHAPVFKRLTAWLIALLLAAGAGCSKCSDSSRPLLWRIEGKKPSFVFGTIHIPDDRLLKLSTLVKDALDDADEVYTEVKMDMASQMKMAFKSMLPDGQTIEDVLPPDLYARVEKLFTEKGIPLMGVKRFKIWAVAVQVALADYIMELAAKQPLDAFIYTQAQEAKKIVGGLETFKEQLQVFESLTQEEQIHLLRNELDEREKRAAKGVDLIKVLLETYLTGDEQELMRRLKEEYDPNDPIQKKLMKNLFTDRNLRMAQRIATKIKAKPNKSFFFAVGAGHIPGDGGVVDLLKKDGFKVTRLGKKK
jgi:uncharacterized protein YbaP (TraB family)